MGVDEAIETHRRAACRHHGHDDPADPRPRQWMLARRQQCPSQRKRQREHRMREADEREIRAEARVIPSPTESAAPAMPLTRNSSTSFDRTRQIDGDDGAALARLDRPQRIRQAERRRAGPRRALEEAARPGRPARSTASPSAPGTGSSRQRWPDCRCRRQQTRRTRRNGRSAARPRQPTGCSADRSPAYNQSRPAGSGPASRAARRARPAFARRGRRALSRYSTGSTPGGDQSSRMTPIKRSIPGHGPLPSRRNATSPADSPRCTLVIGTADASTSARIARNNSGDVEYGACGADRYPHARRGPRRRRAPDVAAVDDRAALEVLEARAARERRAPSSPHRPAPRRRPANC